MRQCNGNVPWDKIEQVSIFASVSIAISITLPVLNTEKGIGVCTLSVGVDVRCEWAFSLTSFQNSVQLDIAKTKKHDVRRYTFNLSRKLVAIAKTK